MVEGEQDQGAERPYRVLSLDGGGMRGIYTAAFLARLTDQFARIRGESALDLGPIGPKLRFWPTRRTIKEHYGLLCV